MDERLARMCASWLTEKFHREGTIIKLEVERQEDIDRLLSIAVVKFSFVDEDGNEGEGVAFVDAGAAGCEAAIAQEAEALVLG